MMSKSAKSASKARRPPHGPQAEKEGSRPGREHQPSDKMVAPPHGPQAEPELSRPGRERRPSDKIAAQSKSHVILSSNFLDFYLLVLEQQEADLLKAQKEECHALREKKAQQKANRLANLASDGEGEYEPRPSPIVSFQLNR